MEKPLDCYAIANGDKIPLLCRGLNLNPNLPHYGFISLLPESIGIDKDEYFGGDKQYYQDIIDEYPYIDIYLEFSGVKLSYRMDLSLEGENRIKITFTQLEA